MKTTDPIALALIVGTYSKHFDFFLVFYCGGVRVKGERVLGFAPLELNVCQRVIVLPTALASGDGLAVQNNAESRKLLGFCFNLFFNCFEFF